MGEHLSDAQWEKIRPFLPKHKTGRQGRPFADDRGCLEGILWVLKSGARWKDLPKIYPSYPTCWRRLKQWEEAGVWERIWRELLRDMDAKGILAWEETFIDASFAPAKKGDSTSASRARARAQSGWWWPMVTAFQSASAWRVRRLANQLSPNERSQLYESLVRAADAREADLFA